MSDNARKVSDQMVNLLGREHQLKKAIEEAKEFVEAVDQLLKAPRPSIGLFRHLIEEAADLELMLDQVRVIFGDDEIDRARAFKLKRTIERFDLKV